MDWACAQGQRSLQARVRAVLDAYRAADLAAARQRRARRQAELTESGGGGDGGGDDPGLIDMPRSAQVVPHQDAPFLKSSPAALADRQPAGRRRLTW